MNTSAADYNWLLLLTTQGLPVLLSPNSKEPDAVKLRILANAVAMEYLKSPTKDKLEFLEMHLKPLNNLRDMLDNLVQQFESEKAELKKSLEAPCQTVEKD